MDEAQVVEVLIDQCLEEIAHAVKPKQKQQKDADDEELKRYIENPFEESKEEIDEFISEVQDKVNDQLRHLMSNIETNMTPDTDMTVYSTGEESKDGSIYSGTRGSLVYYYKKLKLCQSYGLDQDIQQTFENFQVAFETNIDIWKYQSVKQKRIPSFYLGIPGLVTMGYLIFDEFNKESEAAD